MLDDFKHIYRNTVDENLLRPLVNHIESILMQHQDKVKFKTRNKEEKLLGYFSFEGKVKTIPVLFAGGRDSDENKNKRPSIRFRSSNEHLMNISEEYKYPFQGDRKEDWICVEINRDTVNYFPLLMDYEVEKRLSF